LSDKEREKSVKTGQKGYLKGSKTYKRIKMKIVL